MYLVHGLLWGPGKDGSILLWVSRLLVHDVPSDQRALKSAVFHFSACVCLWALSVFIKGKPLYCSIS